MKPLFCRFGFVLVALALGVSGFVACTSPTACKGSTLPDGRCSVEAPGAEPSNTPEDGGSTPADNNTFPEPPLGDPSSGGCAGGQTECPAGQYCAADGTCQAVLCTAGDKRCAGQTPEVCKTDGSGWQAGSACSGQQECQNGACVQAGPCTAGATRACYGGPAGTAGIGVCLQGKQTCSGGSWGACVGDTRPSAETCDGKDNDCNGQVDDNVQGDPCSNQKGVCQGARKRCENGAWVACTNADYQKHAADWSADEQGCQACDQKDNDCDGQVDEGCNCQPGVTRGCYSADASTKGVGECKEGTQACTNQCTWGVCRGEVTPKPEICDNQKDEDCNGTNDNNCGSQSINLVGKWGRSDNSTRYQMEFLSTGRYNMLLSGKVGATGNYKVSGTSYEMQDDNAPSFCRGTWDKYIINLNGQGQLTFKTVIPPEQMCEKNAPGFLVGPTNTTTWSKAP